MQRLPYVPTLDGWRAVAIAGVLVCHGAASLLGPAGAHVSDRGWYGLSRHGALGVDVFFGISGLLICGRLLEEARLYGRISLGGFYVRRAFRILPAALAYICAVWLLTWVGLLPVSGRELWGSLLFFRNYMDAGHAGGWYTAHFWSLAVEEHFYLILPGLVVLYGSRRVRRVIVLLACFVAAWRVIDFHGQILSPLLGGVSFYERTDVRLDGPLWGCCAATLLVSPRSREFLERWSVGWVECLLMLAFTMCVAFTPPLAMMWQAALIPGILLGTVLRPSGLLSWMLESRPARWIGKLSYSLYLWQQLFLVDRPTSQGLLLGRLQEWPYNVLAVFACAICSYYVLERPLIRLGQSLGAKVGRAQHEGHTLSDVGVPGREGAALLKKGV